MSTLAPKQETHFNKLQYISSATFFIKAMNLLQDCLYLMTYKCTSSCNVAGVQCSSPNVSTSQAIIQWVFCTKYRSESVPRHLHRPVIKSGSCHQIMTPSPKDCSPAFPFWHSEFATFTHCWTCNCPPGSKFDDFVRKD